MPRAELTDWIERKIRDGTPGERFPDDHELARRFQVGIVSVKTLLKDFKDRGLIARVRNRGTFLPLCAEPDAPEPSLDSPGRLAETLRRGFAQGHLTVGEFVPKVSFLCARYAVSPRTVCTALRTLTHEGIIERSGRSYRFCSPHERRHRRAERSEVWLLSEKSTGSQFAHSAFAPVFQSLEEELLRRGYLFRPRPVRDLHDFFAELPSLRPLPVGVLVWGNLDRAATNALLPVINGTTKVMRSRMPRIVIDCYRNYAFKKVPGVALFARQELVDNSAREMARYLLTRRRPAIFCFPAGSQSYLSWPEMRYKAMASALRTAGARFELQMVSEPLAPPDITRASSVTSAFEGHRFPDAECRRALAYSPLFEKCLSSEARIWVCANDALAAHALCWLSLRRIHVPADIEIVGFDHDPGCFPLGISSYDPDFRRLGYLVAHFIMNDIPVDMSGNAISCTGKVYEKLTTSPA